MIYHFKYHRGAFFRSSSYYSKKGLFIKLLVEPKKALISNYLTCFVNMNDFLLVCSVLFFSFLYDNFIM